MNHSSRLKIAGIEALTGSADPIDVARFFRDDQAYEYEQSLYEFMQAAWPHIDPTPFVPSWHIEAIAEHLEAVCRGDIKRLLINQPPRTSKSSSLVAFDAWVWAQRARISETSGPQVQFLHSSYALSLSVRDSVKTRRLVESPWYQHFWGEHVQITGDQSTKTRFDLSAGGYRLATSVGGALTGEGGSIIVIDDPHNSVEMESEAVLYNTIEWFDRSISTRLNNPKDGAIIVVMQRLSEADLSGHIIEQAIGDWTHLMLPMRYEPERARLLYPTVIGWSDPRTEEGELLTPERFDEQATSLLERQLGPYGAAGQLQQRPEPKGGGILKRDYWVPWESDKFPPMEFIVASLDCAYTTKEENDYSAMSVWGVWHDTGGVNAVTIPQGMVNAGSGFVRESRTERDDVPRVMLMNAWQGRLELHDLVTRVADTCRKFKVDLLLVENKASGQSVAQEIRRLYSHEEFGVQLIDPKGQDKVARAYSIQHLLAEGIVHAPLDYPWADMLVTQCSQFPKGKHDDLVDTVTQALRWLRTSGMMQRADERTAEINRAKEFTGNRGADPLYPV